MNHTEIQKKLTENHTGFSTLILSLNDRDFSFAAGDKWTAGQQLDHIYRSVSTLTQALILPKFVLKLVIGKANRPSKNYDGLVTKYKSKLAGGGRAGGRFIPKSVALNQKDRLKPGAIKKRISNKEQMKLHILHNSKSLLSGENILLVSKFFTAW